MLWIVVAVVLIGAFFVAFRFGTSRGKSPKALPRNEPRTLMTLRLNDIVTHFDRDFIVEGKLTYEDDGDVWYEYMLADGDHVVWLSVDQDDRMEAGLFEEVDDLRFDSKPPKVFDYQGKRYELEEWGRANVSRLGSTGRKSGMSCKYFDYEGPGDLAISVEQWGSGEFEVSAGRSVRPSEFEILPGDEVA